MLRHFACRIADNLKRRGWMDLALAVIVIATVGLFAGAAIAVDPPWIADSNYKVPAPPFAGTPPDPTKPPGVYHPYPQPYPKGGILVQCPDGTMVLNTGTSVFPTPYVDPFHRPPGTNLLPNVETNAFDLQGLEIDNTLPSTKLKPYNLHQGDPVVTEINRTSPTDDLEATFSEVKRLTDNLQELSKDRAKANGTAKAAIESEIKLAQEELVVVQKLAQRILLGLSLEASYGGTRRIMDRAYASSAILHYRAAQQMKPLVPIFDGSGKRIIRSEVTITQWWYDTHIECDTAYINVLPEGLTPAQREQILDAPFIINYELKCLNRGGDDFSPFVATRQFYLKDPKTGKISKNPCPPKPLVGYDASFFPMQDGTLTTLKLKMPPPRYLNLIYTWGWRMHPPRIQATEHMPKTFGLVVPLPGLPKPDPKNPPPKSCCTAPTPVENLRKSFAAFQKKLAEHPELKKAYGITCDVSDLTGYGPPSSKQDLIAWEAEVFCKGWQRPAKSPAKPPRPAPNPNAGKKPKPVDPCKNATAITPTPTSPAICNLDSDPRAIDYAVQQLSALSPARRMLTELQKGEKYTTSGNCSDVVATNTAARNAWFDWRSRTELPDSISNRLRANGTWSEVDLVVCYLNNTIYAQFTEGGLTRWDKWLLRDGAVNHLPPQPANINRVPKHVTLGKNTPERPVLKLALVNGDYFVHGYQNVDFGGARGWENQFKSSVKFGGSGCWFTFGRTHWSPNVPFGAVKVPAALKQGQQPEKDAKYVAVGKERLGFQKLNIIFNYEPSTRLRFYQFDPLHHNVNIYSVH